MTNKEKIESKSLNYINQIQEMLMEINGHVDNEYNSDRELNWPDIAELSRMNDELKEITDRINGVED